MKFVFRGGMFDRFVDIYTETDEELAELIAAHSHSDHEGEENDPPFLELTMQAYREQCEQIVAGATEHQQNDDAQQAVASEVLKYFAAAQQSIEDGDAASAAHFAFYAGWKFEQMRLKFAYENLAETGSKTHEYLGRLRTKQNTAAKARVDRRRELVSVLINETKLTGGALDKWLMRKLEESFGVFVSERTIRGDRNALKR